MLTDTHAHLYFDQIRSEFNQVLEKMSQAGVTTVINIGVTVEQSQAALVQAQVNYPNLKIYSTVGIHPHDISKYTDLSLLTQDLAALEQLYLENKDKVVAVGECGLDFYFHGNPDFKEDGLDQAALKKLQRQVLTVQVDLAKKLNLPLSIHCRQAWSEIFDFTRGTKGVFHCFSGDHEIATQALKSGYYISFAGNITYPKNDSLRQAAKIIPLDRILIETDSPFLAPQSRRGQINDPSGVKEVAQCIAEVKGVLLEQVTSQTTANATQLFRI